MFGRKAQILRRHYMNFSSLPDMRSFEDFSKYYVSTSLAKNSTSENKKFTFLIRRIWKLIILEFLNFYNFRINEMEKRKDSCNLKMRPQQKNSCNNNEILKRMKMIKNEYQSINLWSWMTQDWKWRKDCEDKYLLVTSMEKNSSS